MATIQKYAINVQVWFLINISPKIWKMNSVTYTEGNIFAVELKGRRIYFKACASWEKHSVGQRSTPWPAWMYHPEWCVVFFRAFSITGFQKGWFASDIIFCIIDRSQFTEPFILFEDSHNDHEPICWLCVSLFESYVKCSGNSLQALYFAKFSDIITPLWNQKVAIWWLPSNSSLTSITMFFFITTSVLLC